MRLGSTSALLTVFSQHPGAQCLFNTHLLNQFIKVFIHLLLCPTPASTFLSPSPQSKVILQGKSCHFSSGSQHSQADSHNLCVLHSRPNFISHHSFPPSICSTATGLLPGPQSEPGSSCLQKSLACGFRLQSQLPHSSPRCI